MIELIAPLSGIAAAVFGGAVGYGVLRARVAQNEKRLDAIERRMEDSGKILERLAAVETRLDSVLHYIRDGGYARYIDRERER